jgi:hypothetical protein
MCGRRPDFEEHGLRHFIPKYTTDANAVAEVRKGMNEGQLLNYTIRLHQVCDPIATIYDFVNWHNAVKIASASERQQTIAAIAALTP